jgi:hypothetical protein
MAWYIETWNPADGLAFISRRDGSQAVEVFFVGSPQFHPLPVRNVATAWWAARATFQESAVDITRTVVSSATEQGRGGFAELRFETLPQAITFVRRVFIALGPDTTPFTGSIPTPPLVLGPQGAALTARITKSLAKGAEKRLLGGMLRELSEDPEVIAGLRALFMRALCDMPAAATDGKLEADEQRVALLVLLEKSGLWPSMAHILKAWKADAGEKRGAIPEWQAGRLTASGAAVQESLMQGVLFAIPVPIPMSRPYGRGFPTLGHHFCAASSDRVYLSLLDSPARFLPIFATSLLLAAATVDLAPGSSQYLGRISERAGTWLATAVPDTSLSEVTGAEAFITRVVKASAVKHDEHFAAASVLPAVVEEPFADLEELSQQKAILADEGRTRTAPKRRRVPIGLDRSDLPLGSYELEHADGVEHANEASPQADTPEISVAVTQSTATKTYG